MHSELKAGGRCRSGINDEAPAGAGTKEMRTAHRAPPGFPTSLSISAILNFLRSFSLPCLDRSTIKLASLAPLALTARLIESNTCLEHGICC